MSFSEAEAREAIADWKRELLAEADDGALLLRSLQTTKLGDVWIECEGRLGSRTEYGISRLGDPDLPERDSPLMGVTRQLVIDKSTATSLGVDLDVGLNATTIKVLDLTLGTGFEQENVSTIEIELGVADMTLVEFENPNQALNDYLDAAEGESVLGTSFVVGTLQGRVKVSYDLLDSSGEKVEIEVGLGAEFDGYDISIGPDYVSEERESRSSGTITESGEYPTVFAALVREIPQEARVPGLCDDSDDDDGPGSVDPGMEGDPDLPQTTMFVISEDGVALVEVTVEEEATREAPNWFIRAENISAQEFDLGTVGVFEARNAFGSLVAQDRFPVPLAPGGVRSSTELFPPSERVGDLTFDGRLENLSGL